MGLCGRIEDILNAPSTTHRDRKELIRTMVESVLIEERTNEEIRTRIIWTDEEPDTIIEVKLIPYMHRMIAELAEQNRAATEIASWLNGQGLVTLQNNPWSAETIRSFLSDRRSRVRVNQRAARSG